MGLILGEAGYRMNVLKIKPPLIITTAEADEALAIFENGDQRGDATNKQIMMC